MHIGSVHVELIEIVKTDSVMFNSIDRNLTPVLRKKWSLAIKGGTIKQIQISLMLFIQCVAPVIGVKVSRDCGLILIVIKDIFQLDNKVSVMDRFMFFGNNKTIITIELI